MRWLYWSDRQKGWFECVVLGQDERGGMNILVEGDPKTPKTVDSDKVATHLWKIPAAMVGKPTGGYAPSALSGAKQDTAWYKDGTNVWFPCSVSGPLSRAGD